MAHRNAMDNHRMDKPGMDYKSLHTKTSYGTTFHYLHNKRLSTLTKVKENLGKERNLGMGRNFETENHQFDSNSNSAKWVRSHAVPKTYHSPIPWCRDTFAYYRPGCNFGKERSSKDVAEKQWKNWLGSTDRDWHERSDIMARQRKRHSDITDSHSQKRSSFDPYCTTLCELLHNDPNAYYSCRRKCT